MMGKELKEEYPTLFLVSQYTDHATLAHLPQGQPGTGVQAVSLDPATGQLTLLEASTLGSNPAFIIKHPSKDVFYTSLEGIIENGEVVTFKIAKRGAIKAVARVDAGGRSTCYLNIPKDERNMLVVNYWDAKVAVLPVDEAGRLHEKTHIHAQPGSVYVDTNNPDRTEHWAYRQRWPHSHCIDTEPYTETYHFVCDLGQDKVLVYTLDSEAGRVRECAEVALEPTQGPRHIAFHPTLRCAYIVNELKNTVTALKYNAQDLAGDKALFKSTDRDGLLVEMHTVSTLPDDFQGKGITYPNGVWKAASHCSEIRIHPSGKFLYVGNRGHESLAVFAIDQTTGGISLVQIAPTNGQCPRNFNFDVTGKYVVAGNQNTNTLVSMRIAEDGSLTIVDQVPCNSPNYVFPLPYDESTEMPIY